MSELIYTGVIAFVGAGATALICLYILARRGNCWAITVLGRFERGGERVVAIPGWFGKQADSFKDNGKHGRPTPVRARYGIAVKPEKPEASQAHAEAVSS